jgi:hypothetical protein
MVTLERGDLIVSAAGLLLLGFVLGLWLACYLARDIEIEEYTFLPPDDADSPLRGEPRLIVPAPPTIVVNGPRLVQ